MLLIKKNLEFKRILFGLTELITSERGNLFVLLYFFKYFEKFSFLTFQKMFKMVFNIKYVSGILIYVTYLKLHKS